MSIRFSSHSDEETCGKLVIFHDVKCACMRRKGHEDDKGCIAPMIRAGEADGVRWCCRVPLGEPHTDWCPIDGPIEDPS